MVDNSPRFSWFRVAIALAIFILVFVVAVFGYFGYQERAREASEGRYCASLREQRSLDSSYICTEGKITEKNGISTISLYIGRPSSKVVDQAIFTMNTKTMEILSEDRAS